MGCERLERRCDGSAHVEVAAGSSSLVWEIVSAVPITRTFFLISTRSQQLIRGPGFYFQAGIISTEIVQVVLNLKPLFICLQDQMV